ncbi:unnamed protein product [Diatraea saccharalis]|uniref:snRNA-activating protein complex subunit 3 n=1 Tax=Diatraea saccharalis TaxID=40085 RepID=A0A9P0G333_9NEOP|nr:unnamed protein product [Diatraea saccharalis]
MDDRSGPKMYEISGNLVTPTLITKNLPDQFNALPIYGRPKNKTELPEFYKQKMRQFVGYDLNDEEFDKLSKYCSADHLRTGCEVQMPTPFPTFGAYQSPDKMNEKTVVDKAAEKSDHMKLSIHKKLQLRIENDTGNIYCKKLKYRGIRFLPIPAVEDANIPIVTIGKPLEPGKELLFRVRLYRPYLQTPRLQKKQSRRSVFSCDLLCVGRQPLSVIRDRIVCVNDVGLRLDVSDNPDRVPEADAKTLFPSGFLFINNVFYVDSRPGCFDRSVEIRTWAARRGIGQFPVKDMCTVQLQDIPLRLGHPEVYHTKYSM